MNKLILALVFCCTQHVVLMAQNKETEAKASYLLAEESYSAGNYKTALLYLENAGKQLGSMNCKLLYLKILTEFELYKSAPTYYPILMSSINQFQGHPDVKFFTEEKVIEVAKTKLRLQTEHEEKVAAEKNRAEKELLAPAKFRNYSFDHWAIGTSLSKLNLSHKDSFVFKKKLGKFKHAQYQGDKYVFSGKTLRMSDNGFMGFFTEINLPRYTWKLHAGTVYGIITEGDVVKGYRKLIYNQYSATGGIQPGGVNTTTANTTFAEAKQGIDKVIKNLTDELGFEPIVAIPTPFAGIRSIYRWDKDNKTVAVYVQHQEESKHWECIITQDIIEN